ncbi:flavodoxin domain-containing protein [Actinokineospora sp. HUAS TT18]|uniref:flavodoxin domain-containing protein n=1 Tax=Actinokineospora sp. HUAS TT18 TaxID=3447451 RepID=UPI003F524817
MRVLVTAAGKHGSTMEIAEAIGEGIRQSMSGAVVDVRPAASVGEVTGYDAVVVGSAVYFGRWRPEAVRLVEADADALRERPVWLFSSGPAGDAAPPEAVPTDLIDRCGAVEHRTFGGRIDRARLGWAERLAIKAVKAPEGDFRDWTEISAWAADIARHLTAASTKQETR